MPDPAKMNKTIRETRKENPVKYIMLGNLDCTFDPEKDHYDPKKTVSVFNNNYIQYEIIGDKDKILSINEYLNIIRPYLNNRINDHKTKDEQKIDITMAISFMSFKDFNGTRTIRTKSDNKEIMIGNETDEIIEELFKSFLERYQEWLE